MGKSITVGLDLAKHVFQVHGVDASGRVVVAKAMRRNKLLDVVKIEAALNDLKAKPAVRVTRRTESPDCDAHRPDPKRPLNVETGQTD
jgi:hypothetical protein